MKTKFYCVHELWKYLFAMQELWKCPFETHKLWKIGNSVCNKLIMKNENVCLQTWIMKHLCLYYMNYENICLNTWIMKKWNCSQCMNYEKFFCNKINMN